jgi:hypothetical protein
MSGIRLASWCRGSKDWRTELREALQSLPVMDARPDDPAVCFSRPPKKVTCPISRIRIFRRSLAERRLLWKYIAMRREAAYQYHQGNDFLCAKAAAYD